MSLSEGPQTDGSTPGLGQLGVRLLLGAVALVALLLVLQRWGQGERQEWSH